MRFTLFSNRRFRLAFYAFLFAALIALVAILGVTNRKQGKRKLEASSLLDACSGFPALNPTSSLAAQRVLNATGAFDPFEVYLRSLNVVFASMTLASFDVLKATATYRFDFVALGDFSEDPTVDRPRPKYDLNFTIPGVTSMTFAKGKAMQRQDVTIGLTGDVNDYPFDTQESAVITLEGVFRNTTAGANATVAVVPIVAEASGSSQGFRIDFPPDLACAGTLADGTPAQIIASAKISRTFTTQFFSVMVSILLWILSLLVISISLNIVMRGRKVEPPVIAFSAAILFAIPGVRNAQPGIPPIGSNVDVVGFFWNISLCAVGVTMLLGRYFYLATTTPDPAPPKPQPSQQTVVEQIVIDK
ncbi:uncharacterized protein SPPG_08196 [Spizellomyces punctatus DAOM BR117]|uniref:DUF4436 domain-containing protein n=1 Tax=Spizellomyces punctatus (strain DAOM BR117) TaxID=645134 RepID=A0A0L0H7E9_SPIPD|nr:uncharacterized protein SPPG_08196 [Spizellomyces punctatus DAOM BR117]KNC96613.1 hypothetical protein SPPG_08196 [Spizellomyces punctatus DAOM BR117]|eukprot:XP_016604653.1 hypothetical protein SPPG_08196 [Spizellomyces punctatus DAOM BR117]